MQIFVEMLGVWPTKSIFDVVEGDRNRHGNGARIRGARPGPALILTGKIRVDRGRGRGRVFPDSQIRVRGRG